MKFVTEQLEQVISEAMKLYIPSLTCPVTRKVVLVNVGKPLEDNVIAGGGVVSVVNVVHDESLP